MLPENVWSPDITNPGVPKSLIQTNTIQMPELTCKIIPNITNAIRQMKLDP